MLGRFGNLVSRDWSVVTSASISWTVTTEQELTHVTTAVLPLCTNTWLEAHSHTVFVAIGSHPDVGRRLADLRIRVWTLNCWLFLLMLLPLLVGWIAADSGHTRRRCGRICLDCARICSSNEDSPLLPSGSAPLLPAA